MRARNLMSEGKLEEAARAAERACEGPVPSVEANITAGRILASLHARTGEEGLLAGARGHFEEAARIAPNRAFPLVELSALYLNQAASPGAAREWREDVTRRALEYYNQAIERYTANPHYRIGRIDAMYRLYELEPSQRAAREIAQQIDEVYALNDVVTNRHLNFTHEERMFLERVRGELQGAGPSLRPGGPSR